MAFLIQQLTYALKPGNGIVYMFKLITFEKECGNDILLAAF